MKLIIFLAIASSLVFLGYRMLLWLSVQWVVWFDWGYGYTKEDWDAIRDRENRRD